MDNSPRRRPLCPRCARPLAACLCRWVVPTANRAEVLLLQHPLEVGQAKGSATLLQLGLARCRSVIGEQFESQVLQQLLAAQPGTPLLLYPATPDVADAGPLLAPQQLPAQPLLVALDATWRKSRLMLHLNPLLRALPRLALAPQALPLGSAYAGLRKAQRPEQLSTLEAVSLVLQQLEADDPAAAARYAALRQGFTGFVTDRLQRVPSTLGAGLGRSLKASGMPEPSSGRR